MTQKKRILKTSLVLLFVILIFTTICIPVNAASSAVFSLSADYNKLSVGQTFSVVISVDNINDPVGIVLIESYLYYDDTCFEIIKWINKYPKTWSSDYEDCSIKQKNDEESYFYSSFLTPGVGKGVTQDGVLSVEITFKVLSENANGKQLVLKDAAFTNEDLEQFACNTAFLTVNLDKGAEASIGSIPESSVETGSSEITTDSSLSSGSSEQFTNSTDAQSSENSSDVKTEPSSYIIWIIAGIVIALAAFSLIAAYLAEKKKRRIAAARRRKR